MNKRESKETEAALRDFSVLIQRRIKEDLNFWKHRNPAEAKGREMAYRSCLFELNEALSNHGLTMGDMGLGGYEVPDTDVLE
ncbi:hypothetical protein [Hydrogenophaga sp. 5NK40-0174]|uniref:hypothetical protein n=1 Tax=Hydrogenophaga sp. 5NK40-0174 TaxID=3127649 RepID=UPI0031048471